MTKHQNICGNNLAWREYSLSDLSKFLERRREACHSRKQRGTSPDLSAVIGDFLRAHDYDVEVCANGKLAIDLLTETDYQCVVTYLRMPVMSGIDLCVWIRGHLGMIPIVTMSGYERSRSRSCGVQRRLPHVQTI